MTDDFWSDPEMFGSDEYIKFEAVGDTVTGTILAIRKHMFDDGKVVPQIELDTADGARTLTAGQVRLKVGLQEIRPKVGDTITVTLTNVEKRSGGKTLKHFDVTKGVPATVTAPATAAPAADPLAGLTPEQVAALRNLI